MKKSKRSERRNKKKEEENFWKIMYLTSDDDDHPVIAIPRAQKLPVAIFKPFFNREINRAQQGYGLLNVSRHSIGAGIGLAAVVGGTVHQLSTESNYLVTTASVVASGITTGVVLYNLIKSLFNTPPAPAHPDGSTEAEVDYNIFSNKNPNDNIIKEWERMSKDIKIQEDIKSKLDVEDLINYYTVFKIVNKKVNNWRISEDYLKKLELSETSVYTIGNVLYFFKQIRNKLSLKGCKEDMKFTQKSSVGPNIYLGMTSVENLQRNFKIDFDKTIVEINVKSIYTSGCETDKNYQVYLDNFFVQDK